MAGDQDPRSGRLLVAPPPTTGPEGVKSGEGADLLALEDSPEDFVAETVVAWAPGASSIQIRERRRRITRPKVAAPTG